MNLTGTRGHCWNATANQIAQQLIITYVCIALSVAVFGMFSLVGIDNSGVQWRSREPDELCKA